MSFDLGSFLGLLSGRLRSMAAADEPLDHIRAMIDELQGAAREMGLPSGWEVGAQLFATKKGLALRVGVRPPPTEWFFPTSSTAELSEGDLRKAWEEAP